MNVLSVETSWKRGSVALLDGTSTVSERRITPDHAHGRKLAPTVLKALNDASLSVTDLDLLTVDRGPGSYTGLRIGVSFVKTLAYTDQLPVSAVPAPDAVAADAPEDGRDLVVVIDAEWNEVYAARYERRSGEWTRDGDVRTADPETVAEEVNEKTLVLGNGLDRYGETFEEQGAKIGERANWFPQAVTVGRLGRRAFREGETVDPVSLQPLYLRPTQADV